MKFSIKDLIFVECKKLIAIPGICPAQWGCGHFATEHFGEPNLVSSSLRNSEITSFLDVWFPVTCVNASTNLQQLVQSYIRENLCL